MRLVGRGMGYTMGLGTASGRKWTVVEERRMKCLCQREAAGKFRGKQY